MSGRSNVLPQFYFVTFFTGAMTFSKTTLSITTLRINPYFATLRINGTQHKRHSALQSAIMLGVVMPSAAFNLLIR